MIADYKTMKHKEKNELIAQMRIDIADADSACNDLLAYLNSEKFHCNNELDNYVCCDDVRSAIMRIKENL
jgi:hypothetical protein